MRWRARSAPHPRRRWHGCANSSPNRWRPRPRPRLAEAHPELIRFILNAQSAGLRLVLVITGKGKPGPDHGPIPVRTGVLRHQVPHWLHMAPLGPAVLQVTEAHLKHGGGGAYYVYLRRGR
ncbi:MAG: hypothetical protein B7Y02_15405 [Rhodobacterales bacterium 17-64-5]|nr:MAG: hypothetical protein B7Y02_15405 [Rhodobacterales bacterium 17-64-5]